MLSVLVTHLLLCVVLSWRYGLHGAWHGLMLSECDPSPPVCGVELEVRPAWAWLDVECTCDHSSLVCGVELEVQTLHEARLDVECICDPSPPVCGVELEGKLPVSI